MKTIERVLEAFTIVDIQNAITINRCLQREGYTFDDMQEYMRIYTTEQAYRKIHRKKWVRPKRTKEENIARKRMLKETIYGPIKHRP